MRPPSLVTMNDNVLAAMDVETTGRDPYFNEIVQIAIVPLDCHLNPSGTPFVTKIRPLHPERMHPKAVETHGMTAASLEGEPDPYSAADSLCEWFQTLQMVPGKRLIPLMHNCQFDIPFIQHWLGQDLFYDMIGFPTRDTQSLVSAIMDKAAFKGVPIPVNSASLKESCKAFGVQLDNAHDALADTVATAALYRALITRGNW